MRLSQRVHILIAVKRSNALGAECSTTHSVFPYWAQPPTQPSFVFRNLIYWNCSFFMMLFIYWQTYSVHWHFINTISGMIENESRNKKRQQKEKKNSLMLDSWYRTYRTVCISSLPSFLVILLSLFCVSRVNAGEKKRHRWKMWNGSNDKANTKNSYTQTIYMKHYLYYSKQAVVVSVGERENRKKWNEEEIFKMFEFVGFFFASCLGHIDTLDDIIFTSFPPEGFCTRNVRIHISVSRIHSSNTFGL